MKRKIVITSGMIGVFLALFLPLGSSGEETTSSVSATTFAYVSSNYIITAEPDGEHAFLVNVINLSDYIIVLQPHEFIYRGVSGQFYCGQVFAVSHNDTLGQKQLYTASTLMRGHTFVGLKIVGAFHEQDAITELSVRIGARRFYLDPLDKLAFAQLAKKIQHIDMEDPDTAGALEAANIKPLGYVKSNDGNADWDADWKGLLLADGVNPPKILKRTPIELTPEAKKTHTYGEVRLTGIITKSGALRDLRVTKRLGKGLDERAMEGVANSWTFLPATQNGEVHETQIPITVQFAAPEGK